MIIAIELAMLTRMTKRVFVEVPDDFLKRLKPGTPPEDFPPLEKLMKDVYEVDEGMGFELDDQWGCEEGMHSFVAKCISPGDPHPDYRLNEDGIVELVETTDTEDVLLKLSDCLWPGGDKDNEWDSDTIDFVAQILIAAGYGPDRLPACADDCGTEGTAEERGCGACDMRAEVKK